MLRFLRECRYLAEYLLFLNIYVLIRTLPDRPHRVFVGLFGRLLYRVLGHDRRWCVRNLELIYGDRLSSRERARLARRAFEGVVHTRSELLRWSPEWMAANVTAEGFEHVAEVMRRGDGLIGITGHLGNYELIPAYGLSQGFPVAWVFRPQDNWRIEAILHRSRQRYLGPHGLPRIANSLLGMWGMLRAGHATCLLIDQNTLDRPLFVDFLGFPAASSAGVAALALATRVPVLLAMCVRQPDGRHHITYHPPFELIDTGNRACDLVANTQGYMTAIERYVLAYPEQYNWPHPRWRYRPDGSFWSLDTPVATMLAERVGKRRAA
jgi:KDO2-lipid IV(A) lauroyltransferase